MATTRSSTRNRAPVTGERLVAVSRALLVEGGPPAIVVREVARRLGVTAPALYKHVAGRDDLLTLLIASCLEEVAAVTGAAARAVAAEGPEGELRAATLAFRAWASANPAEFGLAYGTPVPGYAAPPDGPTTLAARDVSAVFITIFVALEAAGRLRVADPAELPPALARDLSIAAATSGIPLGPGALHTVLSGWQRMLGLVSVEVAGHLGWTLPDTEAFVLDQLERLLTDLVVAPVGAAG